MTGNVPISSENDSNVPDCEETRAVHISDEPTTLYNWYKKLNWWGILLTVMIPIIGGVLALRTPLRRETVGFSIFYYFCTGCGITAGEIASSSIVSYVHLTYFSGRVSSLMVSSFVQRLEAFKNLSRDYRCGRR